MFNAIIGHPQTYKRSNINAVFSSSITTVYHLFVNQAKKMNPRYLSMIIPAKWLSDEVQSLQPFKECMFSDRKLRKLYDYENTHSYFPSLNSGGGFCFFLWDREYYGDCAVTYTPTCGNKIEKRCSLQPTATYIRDLRNLSIIDKVSNKTAGNSMDTMVSSASPFGLATNTQPHPEGDLVLRHRGGFGLFTKTLIKKNKEWIDKWKIMITRLGDNDKTPRRCLLTLEVLPPNHVCTQTYLVIGAFNSKKEAENLLSYLKTKFARFLISSLTSTQYLNRDKFKLVPIQDFSKPWTDKELYEKYKLTKEEIELIETKIRPH